MKLIKKPMTLEQYEAKYPHYQTKLISFSDNEIKEFNSKFHKSNGKDIPNKYALLEKYKWVHIKDRYYQVPRISKLGKAGITLGGAAAIAAGIVLPIKFLGNNVTVTEEEFKDSLKYLITQSADRKFNVGESSLTYTGDKLNEEKFEFKFKCEVDGYKEKDTIITSAYTDVSYVLTDDKKDTYLYTNEKSEDKGEFRWFKYNNLDHLVSNVLTSNYKIYQNDFSLFKKKSGDTYVATQLDVYAPMFSYKAKGDCEISFNKDKTVKKVKETMKVEIPESNEARVLTFTTNFNEIGTHKLENFPNFTEADEKYNLAFNENRYENTIYSTSNEYYINFEFTTVENCPFDRFSIYYDDEIEKAETLATISTNPTVLVGGSPVTYTLETEGEGTGNYIKLGTEITTVNKIAISLKTEDSRMFSDTLNIRAVADKIS